MGLVWGSLTPRSARDDPLSPVLVTLAACLVPLQRAVSTAVVAGGRDDVAWQRSEVHGRSPVVTIGLSLLPLGRAVHQGRRAGRRPVRRFWHDRTRGPCHGTPVPWLRQRPGLGVPCGRGVSVRSKRPVKRFPNDCQARSPVFNGRFSGARELRLSIDWPATGFCG